MEFSLGNLSPILEPLWPWTSTLSPNLEPQPRILVRHGILHPSSMSMERNSMGNIMQTMNILQCSSAFVRPSSLQGMVQPSSLESTNTILMSIGDLSFKFSIYIRSWMPGSIHISRWSSFVSGKVYSIVYVWILFTFMWWKDFIGEVGRSCA